MAAEFSNGTWVASSMDGRIFRNHEPSNKSFFDQGFFDEGFFNEGFFNEGFFSHGLLANSITERVL